MQKRKPPAEQPTVFICYRRAETEDLAGRVSDALKAHFGARARVFRDYDDIRAGDIFPEVIDKAIGASKALVALIGRQWLTITDAKTGRRRLDDERDHVRLEIASALRANVRVVPVLVQDASMPGEDDLPEDLKPLATRNALELSSGKRWGYDLQQLISELELALTEAEATPRPGPPAYLAPAEQFQRYLKEPRFRKGLLVTLALAAAALAAWLVLPVNMSENPSDNVNTAADTNINAAPQASPVPPAGGEFLRRGSASPEVGRLQDELISLGYLSAEVKNTAAGIFGPLTEKGLKRFQLDIGLGGSGVYDEATQAAVRQLNEGVRRGSEGRFVGFLQHRLVALGYLKPEEEDAQASIFGTATEAALKSFQRQHGILPTGIMNHQTYRALIAAVPPVSPTPTPTDLTGFEARPVRSPPPP